MSTRESSLGKYVFSGNGHAFIIYAKSARTAVQTFGIFMEDVGPRVAPGIPGEYTWEAEYEPIRWRK